MQAVGLRWGLLEIFSAVSNFIKYLKRNGSAVFFTTTTSNYKQKREVLCKNSLFFWTFSNSDLPKYFLAASNQGRAEVTPPQASRKIALIVPRRGS